MAEKKTKKSNQKEFEDIVLKLIQLATELKKYDYFASLTIISAIQLMLSKSEQYVQQMNEFGNRNELVTPDEMAADVDNIIRNIKERLSD